MHLVATELRRDRGDVFASRGGEIIQRMQPATGLQGPHDILGGLAAIHLVAAISGDPLEGRSQIGLAVQRPDPGCLSVWQEDARGMLIAQEHLFLQGEVEMHPRGNRVAVPGKADRRLQQFGEWFGSVIGDQPVPCVNGAGHDDRVRTLSRYLGQAVFTEPVYRGRRWCPARTVIGDDLC